ncbi:MAG: T9SS type A sorting domain-containing protein [Candidatus Eisenbacteria bacterium]|nr:T9SS type A sorting domain-containing protein [Candidatus Eisenbacteria bacterium]
MQTSTLRALMAALLLCLVPSATLALEPYYQNFEELDETSSTALSEDGWLVFGNVFTPDTTFIYGYGPFPAPNHDLAFCQIVLGEGGEEQGEKVLSVFSDYENADHGNGNLIESNVYQEQIIGAEDIGSIWRFAFQHKRGNIEGASSALAFIKTLDPEQGYLLTNYLTSDMTFISDTWGGDSLIIVIDESLENQLLQIGFLCLATNYEGSGIFYDNLVFDPVGNVSVPEAEEFVSATLGQNAPNPFEGTTRIDYSLAQSDRVELAVLDITGRRVALLPQGVRGAGSHQVVWDGRTAGGDPAPSGIYWYVLRTGSGQVSGRMIRTQ